uniref:Protein on ecdysone puffs n=1 Tax=Corethrella appendiculata TaxID=1370023 RepID=U5EW84_9DIPT
MAYRNNNNRNRSGNFGNGYGRVNPWDSAGVGGRGGNQDALSLANSLINNILRNQNSNQVPPSLLDMANNGGGGGRYDDLNGFGFIRGRNGRNMNRNMKGGALKGGIRKPNAHARSKNVLAKNSKNSKSDDATDASGNKKKGNNNNNNNKKNTSTTPKQSPYLDIPNDYLYCHMCDKHMYDCTSFDNHLIGRTHRIMKESIEESYRMRAILLRQEARIAEQLKTIEIERNKRQGKQQRNKNREYCPMCELYFYGHISVHRKSEKHLELKKFLHPKCDDCTTEFHNRTEYDEHLISPKHMKNAKTKPNKLDFERKKNQLHISTEAEELQDLREDLPPREKKGKKKTDAAKKDGDAAAAGTEEKEGENGEKPDDSVADVKMEDADESKIDDDEAKDGEEGEEKKEQPESENVILDYREDVDELETEIETRLPKYNKNRSLGISLIAKLDCIECKICNKYFDTEKTAEIHSRTHTHYRSFIRLLNEKSNEVRIAQKRAAAALEEVERRKKQKLSEEAAAAEGKEGENGEKYDPSEATGEEEKNESGDVSMSDDAKADEANSDEAMQTDAAKEEAAGATEEEDKSPSKDEDKGKQQKGRRRAGRYGGRY